MGTGPLRSLELPKTAGLAGSVPCSCHTASSSSALRCMAIHESMRKQMGAGPAWKLECTRVPAKLVAEYYRVLCSGPSKMRGMHAMQGEICK